VAPPRRLAPPPRPGLGITRRTPVFGHDDRALSTRLVLIDSEDGQQWDGMLFEPARGGDPMRRRLAVLVVHGSVGNYLTGVPRRISFGLANAGFTVLSINTRMANYGVFFGGGLMHQTPRDIGPAVAYLRRVGFKRIVLLGFSLGATMVTHFQALREPEGVVGLCTVAHPASLPGSLRRRWEHFGAQPGYESVTRLARARIGADPEDPRNDRILIVRRSRGPTDEPLDAEIWTYRTWWFSRGPEAPHAESRLRVGEVSVPIGIFQAGEDELVMDDEGALLAGLARQGRAPSVELHTIEGADHVFSGRDQQLVEAVAEWLDARTS
jgi:dienelactone hydrolase